MLLLTCRNLYGKKGQRKPDLYVISSIGAIDAVGEEFGVVLESVGIVSVAQQPVNVFRGDGGVDIDFAGNTVGWIPLMKDNGAGKR